MERVWDQYDGNPFRARPDSRLGAIDQVRAYRRGASSIDPGAFSNTCVLGIFFIRVPKFTN